EHSLAARGGVIGAGPGGAELAWTPAPIDLFVHSGLLDARDESFDTASVAVDRDTRALFLADPSEEGDPRPEAMLKAVRERGGKSVFLKFIEGLGGRVSRDAILAAIATTIAWGPLMRKRI